MTRSSLTVFFENPFWIGLYERMDDGKYEVCKITFGAEPKDYEIYEYMLQNWKNLKFSPPIKGKEIEELLDYLFTERIEVTDSYGRKINFLINGAGYF